MWRNVLDLSENHPSDNVWVGVSAADDQYYIPDQRAPVDTRPGNESAISAVLCAARYRGRPEFDVPPPLELVPQILAPEPNAEPVRFPLSLEPFLVGTGLSDSDRIAVYHASVADVFRACTVAPDGRILGRSTKPGNSSPDVEIVVPNPDDRAAVAEALEATDTEALANRYAVYLAGAHPYRDELFERVAADAVVGEPFGERLPPAAGRYVYRVRLRDKAGNTSAGGAMCAIVLRVPSVLPPAPPQLVSTGPEPGAITIATADDATVTHMCVFSRVEATGRGATLARLPVRGRERDDFGMRLRLDDGQTLTPVVKDLGDADVVVDAATGRRAWGHSLTGPPGARISVWACAISRDGIPSALAGSWPVRIPLADVPIPDLAVFAATDALVTLAWSWPTGTTPE